jgi:hypothetical protein
MAASIGRRPAAQSVVFLAGLGSPAVDTMARQPDAVDVDNRKNHHRKPDDDADGAQVAGNGGCDGQRHDGFQDAAPERLARIEAPEDDVAHREQHSHQREWEKHEGSVRRNGNRFPLFYVSAESKRPRASA